MANRKRILEIWLISLIWGWLREIGCPEKCATEEGGEGIPPALTGYKGLKGRFCVVGEDFAKIPALALPRSGIGLLVRAGCCHACRPSQKEMA